MNEKTYRKIFYYLGFALLFLGTGWIARGYFGEVYIKLYDAVLILIGVLLIALSLKPKKKK